jgi:hypothetical protein
MINGTEGVDNDTLSNNRIGGCTLQKYHVWPSSCSETMIFHYKWISLVLGLAFTVALSFLFKYMALRLIQSKFKVNLKDSTVRLNILSIMACICGMLEMSNYKGYHHNDSCVSTVSMEGCTSILITTM